MLGMCCVIDWHGNVGHVLCYWLAFKGCTCVVLLTGMERLGMCCVIDWHGNVGLVLCYWLAWKSWACVVLLTGMERLGMCCVIDWHGKVGLVLCYWMAWKCWAFVVLLTDMERSHWGSGFISNWRLDVGKRRDDFWEIGHRCKIILKWILQMRLWNVNCIFVVPYMVQW